MKSNLLTQDDINKIYKSLNLPDDCNIDKNDYLDFYNYFGNNLSLYKSLVDTKNKAKVTWKEFRNLKFENIDFQNKTISIPKNIEHEILEIEK